MTKANALVFIVDDDELVLESLCASFVNAGFAVEAYHDTQAFLNNIKPVENACLILDLNMPEHSGLEIQKELNHRQIELPIIVYSGSADVKSAVEAMQGGALTLLQKPTSTEVLIDTVLKAIEKQHLQNQVKHKKTQAKSLLNRLSKREKTIAAMVAQGYSAASIAEQLFISSRTVEAHKSSIFNKLDMSSVAKLTQLMVISGALDE